MSTNTGSEAQRSPGSNGAYHLSGHNELEVVGEYYRQHEFQEVTGDLSPGEYFREEMGALLIPEPDNPYDGSAVSVRVHGATLGYLSREDATEWSPIIRRIVASGYIPTVNCFVVRRAAFDPDDEDNCQVWLRMPELATALPINDAPPNSTLIPTGGKAQVTKEENRFDYLFNYVPQSGEGKLYLELRLGSRTLRNGESRSIVYVYLDDEEVGELSSTTGAKIEPILQHAEDEGRRVVVDGAIQGSALSASLTFRAAKSDEIPDSWVKSLPSAPGPLVPEANSYAVPPAYRPSWSETHPAKPARRKKQPAAASSGGCAVLLLAGFALAGGLGSVMTYII